MPMERRTKTSDGNVIVGLDVGTTKICSIMGEVHEDENESMLPSNVFNKIIAKWPG